MNRMNKSWRLVIPVFAALILLLCASIAHAEYEQVPEQFGVTGEANIFLNAEVRGLAINETGVGGVPAGSIYAATRGVNGPIAVVRLSPGVEGEAPQFEEAWGWEIGAADGSGFQRCGPALITEPTNHTFHTCREKGGEFGSPNQPHYFAALSGIAVDQENGFVYVRNNAIGQRTTHLVEIFTATGTPVGEGFGDVAPHESIAESPGKLHARSTPETESMTIGEDGTVYLTDSSESNGPNPAIFRVLSFAPAGGTDFANYVYTGAANDLRLPFAEYPNRLAWAGHGHLIAGKAEQLHEYSVNPPSGKAVCSSAVSGKLDAVAANALTGEVFYFNQPKSTVVHLGPCNEETHKFPLTQQLVTKPKTELVKALAINPTRSWSPARAAGILYLSSQVEFANSNGGGTEFFGDIFAPSQVFSPTVALESVANTGVTSTTLRAQIDPHGLPTRYVFEYLPASQYTTQRVAAEGEGKTGDEAEDAAFAGALTAPSGVAVIQGGAASISASVSGLNEGTQYRFRAVASNECLAVGEPLCTAAGAAAQFATYPTAPAGLPDGRAYELVSPTEKNGGEVFPAEADVGSCGVSPCKPPGGSAKKVDPMQSAPNGDAVAYMGFPFSATEGSVINSYVSRRTPTGWRTTNQTPPRQEVEGVGTYAYSPDLAEGTVREGTIGEGGASQILLRQTSEPSVQSDLVPAPRYRDPEEFRTVYGGSSSTFYSQLFSANDSLTGATANAPEPPDPGVAGEDLYLWNRGVLSLVNVLPGNTTAASGAAFASASADARTVSADGSRVFWKAGGSLYVREGASTTQRIEDPGNFIAASESGELVLLSDGCLYSLSSGGCLDLTGGAAGFMGLTGADGEFGRIYFVDSAKLPGSGTNERGVEAVVGKPNLYLYEAGASTRFIATLAPSDGNSTNGPADLNDWGVSSAVQRTAEASPDGRYLAFVSTETLTGYGNVGPCARATKDTVEEIASGPCKEVFLYDSVTGHLACPSCNPTGEAPLGNSTLRRITSAKPYFPQPRYLTNAGRLFFDSSDRLSAQDTNGNVEDVYEYEPEGVGSCARVAGCVLLISPGSGTVDSNFLAMDEGGANVFFTSREPLVQKDSDDLIDLYDAREGGGFPADTETQRGECQGESCQPVATAPNDVTPASSSFHGAGNVKEAAKKPKKKHKHHKKHKQKKHGRTANYDRGGAK